MLGFGKKKKEDSEAAAAPKKGKAAGKPAPSPEPEPATETKPRKRRFSVKKLFLILVVLGVLSGGGFTAYLYFFKPAGPERRVYREVPLPHVSLPKEMVKFSFDHYPALYDAFIEYDREMATLEAEIKRIDGIAAQYPEEKKIADRQKKVWEKGKEALAKAFSKLEKPVKETFVLFQVNPNQGQAQVEATSADLAASAKESLNAVRELTDQIRAMEPQPPKGMINGVLYKLKTFIKKFL